MLESASKERDSTIQRSQDQQEDQPKKFNPEAIPKPPEDNLGKKISEITASCNVLVMSGSSSKELPVARQKVGEVRQLMKIVLNIADGAIALVNGKEVTEDTALKANDRLEFVRRAGSKGSTALVR